jgi:hypothetical protein
MAGRRVSFKPIAAISVATGPAAVGPPAQPVRRLLPESVSTENLETLLTRSGTGSGCSGTRLVVTPACKPIGTAALAAEATHLDASEARICPGRPLRSN